MIKSTPNNWPTIQLRDCGKWYSGGTPNTSIAEYWNGNIPWITASSLKNFYITDSERRVTQVGLQNGTRKVPLNTILFVVRGMSLNTEFRVGIACREVAFGQDCKAVIAKEGIEPLFLGYMLKSRESEILDLVDQASHGTGRLQTSLLESINIPLPPLAEQRKIAAILGTWDRAIAAADQLVVALRVRKRALMQRLLTGESRFPGFESAWEEIELRECLTPISRTESVQRGRQYNLIGVRWYLEGAHIHDTVSGDNVITQQLSQIYEGDVLYNKMWVTKGAFAIAKTEHHSTYGTNEYPQFRPKSNLDTKFIEYAFHNARFLHDAKALCRGTTGRARLNPEDFLTLRIQLPVKDEQVKIATVLNTCDEEITQHERYLELIRQQKRGLMQRLLTGEVRVELPGSLG
jgi:type I restriction enzyme, S subunit